MSLISCFEYLDHLFIFNEWHLISIFGLFCEYISQLSFTAGRTILMGSLCLLSVKH